MPIGSRRSDQRFRLAIVNHARKFRIKLFKHPGAVFFVKRKQNFAVRIGMEGIASGRQFAFDFSKPVNFAIADQRHFRQERRAACLKRQGP